MNFAVVNSIDADNAGNQKNLTDVGDYPIFQDVKTVDAWVSMGGGKDDIFIYDSQGKLAHYLPVSGSVDTNLSGAGYANLKQLIQATK